MSHIARLFPAALTLVLFSCRPASKSYSLEAGVQDPPIGLAGAVDISEIQTDPKNPSYKVRCLNSTEIETHTRSEVEENKVCPAKSVAKEGATSKDSPGGQTAETISLVFGEPSYLKNKAVDCTAFGCPTQNDACRVGQSSSETVTVTSVEAADTRQYDHIVAQRAATTSCKLTRVYIFFPHLVMPVKFTRKTTLESGCIIATNSVLEGRIEKGSSPSEIKFKVSKGVGCAKSGNEIAFDSENIESTPIIRAILGL
jgi:hypothetical protein